MKQPRTSVVTCTYNMGTLLPSTIRSVLQQSDPDFEYLILDDGSGDGTWDYLTEHVKDNRVHLLHHKKRYGLTECRNELLQAARGKFLSIADADDLLAPHKLQTHAKAFAAQSNSGMVWGRSVIVGEGQGGVTGLLPEPGFQSGWDLVTPYQATHSATTWRRSVLVELGGYDPRWTVVEAVDLFFRVGDRYEQLFTGTIDALKRIDSNNSFRSHLEENGETISRQLLKETLERRYGLPGGELRERLTNATTSWNDFIQ